MGNIQTQVNVTITQQVNTVRPAPQPVMPAQPIQSPQPIFEDDSYTPTVKKPSSPVGMIKKMAGGTLVGGTASTLLGIGVKAMFTENYHAPTAATIGTGAAIGLGIGLLNIETGNKTTNLVKNTAGGALLAGGITATVESASKAIFTNRLLSPSGSGMLLGSALGAGIALVNADVEDKTVNNLKNIAGGALIGGSTVGLASVVVKAIGTNQLSSFSPVAAGIGLALGAGIAILNMEE